VIDAKETDLAAVVVRYFLDLGADVYQEVAPNAAYGGRADIVAVYGPVMHVVECKVSFGLAVIRQAADWIHYAHRVSVAIPKVRDAQMPRILCRHLGIGVLEVSRASLSWETSRVTEVVPPRLSRRIDPRLRKALRDEQRTYAAAGNADGKFWSPFKATCIALREVVAAAPGITVSAAVKRIKHHYGNDRNATSNLSAWIRGGKVDGIELDASARPARLYIAGTVPAASAQAELGEARS
jgi:hypothetical protein